MTSIEEKRKDLGIIVNSLIDETLLPENLIFDERMAFFGVVYICIFFVNKEFFAERLGPSK